MTTKKIFKCNAHADIRDYQQLRVDEKAINAILQNCNLKLVFKENGKPIIVNVESKTR